jgi:hypothetical protein
MAALEQTLERLRDADDDRADPIPAALSHAELHPSFWSFTFPPANMSLFAVRWLQLEHPARGSAYAWALVAAITTLVSSIAARTVLAAARGQLLPSPGSAAARLPSPAAAPAGGAA